MPGSSVWGSELRNGSVSNSSSAGKSAPLSDSDVWTGVYWTSCFPAPIREQHSVMTWQQTGGWSSNLLKAWLTRSAFFTSLRSFIRQQLVGNGNISETGLTSSATVRSYFWNSRPKNVKFATHVVQTVEVKVCRRARWTEKLSTHTHAHTVSDTQTQVIIMWGGNKKSD